MKKSLLLIIILFITAGAYAQQDSLIITGTLQGMGNKKVSVASDKKLLGSAYATDGVFNISIPKQAMPVAARLRVEGVDLSLFKKDKDGKVLSGSPPPTLELIIYQSNLTVTGSYESLHMASIKGDKENEAFTVFRNSLPDEWELKKKINLADDNDTTLVIRLRQEMMSLVNLTMLKQKEFVANNPDLYLSFLFLRRLPYVYTAENYEKAFNALDDTYKTTLLAKELAEKINYLQPTAAGLQAIDFTRTDKDGKIINLKDYKGKVVLLDFWGSWCGPCRASHPHLKELYTKYKEKGFEIIGVAQERAETAELARPNWLAAIEKDEIDWICVLNVENIKKQDIVNDYRITGFPTKILLDREGKILLRISASATDDIDKMLEKLFL